jgi:hypothetical protein
LRLAVSSALSGPPAILPDIAVVIVIGDLLDNVGCSDRRMPW